MVNRDAGYCSCAAGNGFGFRRLLALVRDGPRGKRELRGNCQTCGTCGRTQESAARDVPGIGVKAAKVLIRPFL